MTDAGRRLVGASCFLAALWVLVYWLWQPARPGVSFAQDPAEQPDALSGRSETPGSGEVAPETPAPIVRDPLDTSEDTGQSPPLLPPGPSLVEPGPSVPRFREYTIRDGDTFETIAMRELGSRALGGAVARANPLKDPRRLRPGDVIRLPLDPDNVQGTTPAEAPLSPVREAVAAGSVTYTVEPGDSLSKISQLFYGTVRHANLIFESNRDQLRSVDELRAGQVIRIPPLPK